MSQAGYSLKDHLFNPTKVKQLAQRLAEAVPGFDSESFSKQINMGLNERELKARIYWIREHLHAFLPSDFRQSVNLLLASLPAPCDPDLSDQDFGDFIYATYSDFVAQLGCEAEQLEFSLAALRQITTRFSAEFAIRPFFNRFPEQTLETLMSWCQDPHYHVRRLVSEGSRPRLPWAEKIKIEVEPALSLLDRLYTDPTRYVTRSVANHLNDWSKTHPDLVIERLQFWRQQGNAHDFPYIQRHALRSLIKQGHLQALALEGYAAHPQIRIENLRWTPTVTVGESLVFSFDLIATQAQDLMIDYCLRTPGSSVRTARPREKVFKLKRVSLAAGERQQFVKKHPLRPLSTRQIHAGDYAFALQINGQRQDFQDFVLCAQPSL